ncbi:hypothetical protein SAMN04488511_102306 [Pedobacter suwonensis]|uniref:Uncharacterized protein n=1 Tax=Pedobacter suwonensis TaxID=332999 RepID=A0A1I0SPG2_9SPHI|nr:hypothetical protein [Pedobacter suwonensis]SFA41362.1 hypothetical protein SAMN04488511_102306 [Pedobacter suwonensis]
MVIKRNILSGLKTGLENLKSEAGNRLSEIHLLLNDISDYVKSFEDEWIGAWAQQDYNYYRYERDEYKALVLDANHFYQKIIDEKGVDLKALEKEVWKLLDKFKEFKEHIVTELSGVRNIDDFAPEVEVLEKIAQYEWGIHINDFISLVKPKTYIVRDYSKLNRPLDVPPHLTVAADLLAITSQAFSVKEFFTLANRLIRQIELKQENVESPELSAFSTHAINNLLDNFHSFYNQLKHRYNQRPTIEIIDEYDVQDLLHALLKLHFKDVRAEEYTPSYAGSSTRMDFLLKEEKIVIEVKKTRERLTDREVGQQLILDAAHYSSHPNCKEMICFVYDPENRIKNPRGLEKDISEWSTDSLKVTLLIRP